MSLDLRVRDLLAPLLPALLLLSACASDSAQSFAGGDLGVDPDSVTVIAGGPPVEVTVTRLTGLANSPSASVQSMDRGPLSVDPPVCDLSGNGSICVFAVSAPAGTPPQTLNLGFMSHDLGAEVFCTVRVASPTGVAFAFTDVHLDVEAALASAPSHGRRAAALIGESRAMGVNDAGQVVGYIERAGRNRAFLWRNHVVTDLGDGTANAISADGWITGERDVQVPDPSNPGGPPIQTQHAFLWRPDAPNGSTGAFQDLGTLIPPDEDPYASSVGTAINDAHQVAGDSWGRNGLQAFLYSGGMVDLGAVAGAAESHALGINASGQVSGIVVTPGGPRAAFWPAPDQFVDLHPPSGGPQSEAPDLNDAGLVIIAAVSPADVFEGYVWQSGQTPIRLQQEGGNLSATPRAINNPGAVVAEKDKILFGFYPGGYTMGASLQVSGVTGEVLHFHATGVSDGGLISGWLDRVEGPRAALFTPQ